MYRVKPTNCSSDGFTRQTSHFQSEVGLVSALVRERGGSYSYISQNARKDTGLDQSLFPAKLFHFWIMKVYKGSIINIRAV